MATSGPFLCLGRLELVALAKETSALNAPKGAENVEEHSDGSRMAFLVDNGDRSQTPEIGGSKKHWAMEISDTIASVDAMV